MSDPGDEVDKPGTPLPLLPRTIDLPDGQLLYWPGLLEPSEADRLRDELHESIDWECQVIRIFGREVPSPRLSAWYGDPGCVYAYSGLSLQPLGWIDPLRRARDRVQRVSDQRFNCVLANLYRDGNDSMGWHSDDEPELGPSPTVASLSLGATRRFLLRHKRRADLGVVELQLGHGDLLLMGAPTQSFWKHQLPKTRRPLGSRINLTFRLIENASEPQARPRSR